MAEMWRPYYLPREFSIIVIVAVYIPPEAKEALRKLYEAVSDLQSDQPERFLIFTGHFCQMQTPQGCSEVQWKETIYFGTKKWHTLKVVNENETLHMN